MKKAVAMVMVLVMMLAFGVTAFAANGPLTVEQAKQAALDFAGVKASEATFTKAHRDWDNGREVYEIEFYANNTEYDMDVDVNTGRITDFSTEYHGGYGRFNNQLAVNTQPGPGSHNQPASHYGYYDDDWDDKYDRDWDDRYDYDYDWDDWYDYDRDFDDMFGWDD